MMQFNRYKEQKTGWFTPRQPSKEAQEFTKLLPNTPITILDAGSGSRSDSAYILKRFTNLVTLDVQEYPDVLASITNIPIKSKSIDAVFCRGVLHILSSEDQIKAIKEFSRILKYQGVLYCTFMISIFTDIKYQLITVDKKFNINPKHIFSWHLWKKGKRVNHKDHSHYFGKFIGIK